MICKGGKPWLRGATTPPPQKKPWLPCSVEPEEADTTPCYCPVSLPPRLPVRVIKCLPKTLRKPSGKKLATVLDAVVSENDPTSWDYLLRFGTRCLEQPGSGGCSWSLATAVNRQQREEADPFHGARFCSERSQVFLEDSWVAFVSAKLEEDAFE